jgi:hypothetical protein
MLNIESKKFGGIWKLNRKRYDIDIVAIDIKISKKIKNSIRLS